MIIFFNQIGVIFFYKYRKLVSWSHDFFTWSRVNV